MKRSILILLLVIIFSFLFADETPNYNNGNGTIDGRKDHWLKVKYKDYTGWIFGGYASAERGGPKYYIPESSIEFDIGWY